MKTVKVLYPDIVDIGCFSHKIDRLEKTVMLPYLMSLKLLGWVCFHITLKPNCFGWNRQENKWFLTVLLDGGANWKCYGTFGNVEPFLKKKNENLPPVKLLSFFTHDKKDKLQVELAAATMRRSLLKQLTSWKEMAH